MAAESVIAGTAASLSLLENLIKLAQAAKNNPDTPLTTAEIMKRLPAEAFGLATNIRIQLVNLRQNLIENGIDLKLPLDQLEESLHFWQNRIDRIPRRALPLVEGLKESLCVLEDDVVAVASCAGMEEFLTTSYRQAREEKMRIRAMADPTRPVGEILDDLIAFAEERSAALGDLR